MESSSILIDRTARVLPEPLSVDDVSAGHRYFIVPVKEAANGNEAKPRFRGRQSPGRTRIAILSPWLGRLVEVILQLGRPDYELFLARDPGHLYDILSGPGADLAFIHDRSGVIEDLRLNPEFEHLPICAIDSWYGSFRGFEDNARSRYVTSGASAVLFIPIDPPSILGVIDSMLPDPAKPEA